MAEFCAICGEPSDDEHHLTGRGPDHCYLDPDLTAPLCHDDHELVGDDLRSAGLERPLAGTTIVERIAHRLERVGCFLMRVAEAVPSPWILALAGATQRWAGELSACIRALDAWNPSWRLADGTT